MMLRDAQVVVLEGRVRALLGVVERERAGAEEARQLAQELRLELMEARVSGWVSEWVGECYARL